MFRRLIFRLAPVALLIFSAVAGVSAQEKTTFHRALPAGRYAFEQNLFFSIVETVSNKSALVQEKAEINWFLVVSQAPQTNQTLVKMMIERVVFQIRDDVRIECPLSFDSEYASVADEPLRDLYQKLLAVTVKIQLDENMRVQTVEGLDALWRALESPDGAHEHQYRILGAVMKNLLSEKTFQEMFAQMFYLLPAEAAAPGERWTNSTQIYLPILGPTEVLWNTVFESADDGVARLAGASRIKLNGQTEVKCVLTADYDLATGVNKELSARSVVSHEEKIAGVSGLTVKKMVSMTRSRQKLSSRH